MNKRWLTLLAVLLAVGWAVLVAAPVSADGVPHTITVTTNITGELGCVYENPAVVYEQACTDCLTASCTITEETDTVGTYVLLDESYYVYDWSAVYTAHFPTYHTGNDPDYLRLTWAADVVTSTNWVTYTINAVETTHQIAVTSNITVAAIGYVYTNQPWLFNYTYTEVCTDCVSTTAVMTEAYTAVGVYVELLPDYSATWSVTATVGSFITSTPLIAFESDRLLTLWIGDTYSGTNAVTYTISMWSVATPTPAPTATPDLYSYSSDYTHPYRVYLPLVMTSGGTGDDDGTLPAVYASDQTWWDWAQKIDAFFDPVFENIIITRADIGELHNAVCGTPWTAFTPPLDPTTGNPEFYMLAGDPTVTLTAYVMGYSLGRPMAWLQSIQQSGNIMGLNYFVMLVYFLMAGIGWIVFVTVVTYSARLIRYAAEMIVKLYELIPLKAT